VSEGQQQPSGGGHGGVRGGVGLKAGMLVRALTLQEEEVTALKVRWLGWTGLGCGMELWF